MSKLILISMFVIVLFAPLAVSWRLGREVKVTQVQGLELVVITPHQEAIRREFADAFSRFHQKQYGEPVTVSYLTYGAADIVKLFDEKAKTTPGEYRIDVAWGGGDYLFEVQLKRPGYLAPMKLEKQFLAQVYPQPTLAGLPLYDTDQKNGPAWFGTALSSFGIVYNRDLLKYLGVPEPKTWRDMAYPRLAGWVALADPTRSASAKQAYMVIVERAMADAAARGDSEDSGWADGMGLIRQISANARLFADSSSVVPIMVSQGEAAEGMAIDFFARSQANAVGDRLGYVEPENATIINPDPIALVTGAPHRELAEQFIRFVLSPEGQRLWNLKPGTPGGPASSALRRLPIRRDVYADMSNFTDQVNPFQAASEFNKSNVREKTFTIIGELIQASCIDLLEELTATRKAIVASPNAAELDRQLGRFPFDQQEGLRRQAKYRDRKTTVSERLEMQRDWAEQFRAEYAKLRNAAKQADRPGRPSSSLTHANWMKAGTAKTCSVSLRNEGSMSDLHYFEPAWIQKIGRKMKVDVCVYGATAAGIVTAIRAKLLGKSVALLHPGKFIGGLSTGGLGWTDYGRKHVIGGLAREFYKLVGAHYRKDEEFHFEPRVATAVLTQMLHESGQDVILCQYLDQVENEAGRIKAILMLSELCVEAKLFIDATYEGDLMAKAGVSYTVGREGNDVYSETLNGIQVKHAHQFSHPVDPYVHAGDPTSGLLPCILPEDLSRRQGKGDKRVQAYCFRVCMTDDPALIVPWQRPEKFDPLQYVLAERWFRGEKDSMNEHLRDPSSTAPAKFDILPNKTAGGFSKTDTNNHGPVSSDFIGANWDWPEATYVLRERIFQAHVNYQQGFYWFMANSERIPERYRRAYARWGLPKDEFVETGHWPHQLYIREARRMLSDYIITEHDCRGARRAEDSIGMGSYGMDSHNCSRFVKDGRVLNEGDVQVGGFPPYPIPYRSITPKASECQNLLVPICLSSSHIAYGSARMEPVFMVLGESAAYAANMAIESGSPVQAIGYPKLREQLLVAQQVLESPK